MRIFNRRAKFDFELEDKIEAGIVLSGAEVKAFRGGRANLTGSFVRVLEGELYLVGAALNVDGAKDYNPTRSRKLLVHKREALTIETKAKARKLTLVPISMYTKGRRIKLEIALARPKKKFEKKESIKKKDMERDLARELKDEK